MRRSTLDPDDPPIDPAANRSVPPAGGRARPARVFVAVAALVAAPGTALVAVLANARAAAGADAASVSPMVLGALLSVALLGAAAVAGAARTDPSDRPGAAGRGISHGAAPPAIRSQPASGGTSTRTDRPHHSKPMARACRHSLPTPRRLSVAFARLSP